MANTPSEKLKYGKYQIEHEIEGINFAIKEAEETIAFEKSKIVSLEGKIEGFRYSLAMFGQKESL